LIYSIILADVAIGPMRNIDSGIYHYSILRWTATYSIVPGLANLNARLGFNSSSLLFPTLLDSGFWPRSAQHVCSCTLFFALAAQLASSAYRLLTQNTALRSDVFAIFVLGFGVHYSYMEATAFSTDAPVFALSTVVFFHIFRIVCDEISEPRERAFVTAAVVFLAAVAISAKLSVCVLVGSATLILLWMTRRDDAGNVFRKRIVAASIALSAFGLIVWCVRNAIITGYPLFPLTLGALPVDWRLPRATPEVIQFWITGWARKPWGHWKDTQGRWDWISSWWSGQILPNVWEFRIPVALTLFSIVAGLFGKRADNAARKPVWPFLIPNLLSLVYWFLTAPALRLGAGIFWLLAATCAVLAFSRLEQTGRIRLARTFCAAGLLMAFISAAAVQRTILIAGPDAGFFPTWRITFLSFPSDNGVTVLIPADAGEPATWDSPLPTTPYPHRRLALRRTDDLSSGFKLEPFDDSIIVGIPP